MGAHKVVTGSQTGSRMVLCMHLASGGCTQGRAAIHWICLFFLLLGINSLASGIAAYRNVQCWLQLCERFIFLWGGGLGPPLPPPPLAQPKLAFDSIYACTISRMLPSDVVRE